MHGWVTSHTGAVEQVGVPWVDPATEGAHFTLPFVQGDADLKARLAYAIREAREQAGLSRPELAARVGVNRGAVYTWEKGTSVPSLLNLGPLCDALGVDPDLFAHPPAIPDSPVRRYRLAPLEMNHVRDKDTAPR
jgi:DNA-binding XRE family transcriptional regulator